MQSKKKSRQIQTGRTLPNMYSTYSPSRKTSIPAAPPAQFPAQPTTRHRFLRYFGRFLLLFFVAVVAVAVFIGVWDARNISSAEKKMFGTGNLMQLASGTQLKGADQGRVNILLVGYSVDDPGHQGAQLTDSLIVLSMDTNNRTGYMLSIPRDLYVNLGSSNCKSGGQYCKINEAYEDGGIGLLKRVVSGNFQIPIDYYAIIDYAAVRDTVNALGGITIDIKSSDPRGLYDPNISPHDGGPLKLSNGVQQINGQTALNLTRARGDAYGAYGFPQADFDRTQHQRQVLAAIKQKLNWKLVLNPRKNSQILNAVAQNVRTDVQANEARPLFGLFNNIPQSQLKSVSLRELNGKNYLTDYSTYYSGSALIPAAGIDDYSEIDAAIAQLNQ